MTSATQRSDQVNGVYLLTGGAHLMFDELVKIREQHPGQPLDVTEFDGAGHHFMLVIANPDKDGRVASIDANKQML